MEIKSTQDTDKLPGGMNTYQLKLLTSPYRSTDHDDSEEDEQVLRARIARYWWTQEMPLTQA